MPGVLVVPTSALRPDGHPSASCPVARRRFSFGAGLSHSPSARALFGLKLPASRGEPILHEACTPGEVMVSPLYVVNRRGKRRRRGGLRQSGQRSTVPAMKSATAWRASSSLYCTGGLFMK